MSPNNDCFTSGKRFDKLSSVLFIAFILDLGKQMNNEMAKPIDNTQLFSSGKIKNDSEEPQDKPKKCWVKRQYYDELNIEISMYQREKT